MKDIVPAEIIENRIFLIRGCKVMLDSDLAVLYGVSTKVFNQAVKRNRRRFPADFMFRLKAGEAARMRSRSVTASRRNLRYLPFAFTEQGIAMLSGVLNSERAIDVNIAVMRAFIRLRVLVASHKDLAARLARLENKCDRRFRIVFDALREFMTPPEKPRKQIGFTAKEKRAGYLFPAPLKRHNIAKGAISRTKRLFYPKNMPTQRCRGGLLGYLCE